MRIIIVLFSIFTAFALTNVSAAYIELTTGLGGKDKFFNTKDLGSDYYIGAGVFTYNQYTIGLGADVNITGFGYNPFLAPQKISKAISSVTNNDTKKSLNEVANILNNKSSLYSAAYFNVNINDLFGPSGFYAIAGIGYGVQITAKNNSGNVVEVASQLSNLNGSVSEQTINDIANNPEFISALQALSNDPSLVNSLLNSLHPGIDFSSITNQINTSDKINQLVNNRPALENFVSDVNNFAQNNDVNFSNLNINSSNATNLACDTLLDCRRGVAYQLGIGYDLKLISIVHLDLFTKMHGLFVSKPIYSVGAGLKFKF